MNKFQMNGGEVKFHHDGTATETWKDGKLNRTKKVYSIHPGREYMGEDYNPAKRRFGNSQAL